MALQTTLGHKLTLSERLAIFKRKPDFLCMPEYSLISPGLPDHHRAALSIKENLEYLVDVSSSLSVCLIGGTVVEAEGDSLYNCAYVINRGEIVGRYRKLNPTANEINQGVLPGDKIFVCRVEDVRIGILICADVLNPTLFELLGRQQVDIIFIPTISPLRPGESRLEKFRRDEDIFIGGAREACAFIVKTCGVGSIFGKPLQGRSLIASPWAVINRVDPRREASPAVLEAILDIDEIRDFAVKKRLVTESLKND